MKSLHLQIIRFFHDMVKQVGCIFHTVSGILAAVLFLAVTGYLNGAVITVTDDFNRANTTPISSGGTGLGSNWSYNPLKTADAYINNDVAMLYSEVPYYNQLSLSESIVLSADFSIAGYNAWEGLIFNYVDQDSYVLLRYKAASSTGGTSWQLLTYNNDASNPTVTSLGTDSDNLSLNTYYRMTLESTATAGSYTVTLTSADGLTTYVSKTFTSATTLTGYAGFYSATSGAALSVDNFSLTTVPEPTQVNYILFGGVVIAWMFRRKSIRLN